MLLMFVSCAELQSSGADGHLKTPLEPSQPFRRSGVADLPRAIVSPQVQTQQDDGGFHYSSVLNITSVLVCVQIL